MKTTEQMKAIEALKEQVGKEVDYLATVRNDMTERIDELSKQKLDLEKRYHALIKEAYKEQTGKDI